MIWPSRFNFEYDLHVLGPRVAVRFWEEGCHPMGPFHYWRNRGFPARTPA